MQIRTKIKQYHSLILSGIIIIAFLFRIFSWWMDSTISRDGVLYVNMAKTWYESGDYEAIFEQIPGSDWIPFFVLWLMKLLMNLGLSAVGAGLVWAIALGSLLPLVTYGIAAMVCEKKEIALGAALLAALHPSLIELSIEIQRDTPYLFFGGVMIWCLLMAIKYHKWYPWGLGGITGALAVMIRYETFELLFLGFGYLAIAPLLKWKKWQSIVIPMSCFFASFTIMIFLIYLATGVSPEIHSLRYYKSIRYTYIDMFKKNLSPND